MIDQEREDLSTFLLLKYGGIKNMCDLWFTGEIKNLSLEEQNIIVEYLGISFENGD